MGRKKYLDIAKGILIILVVIGHYKWLDLSSKSLIYAFHMPAFFIISGYLFKKYGTDYWDWVKRKGLKFFLPYISFFMIASLILHFDSLMSFLKYFLKGLYSGRAIDGVYWFIPCLFLTEIFFGFLVSKLKKKTILFILTLMYIIAHLESLFYVPLNDNYLNWSLIYDFPWNVDVVLMSTVYFALGYYSKGIVKEIEKKVKIGWFILTSLGCLLFSFLIYFHIFHETFNMKISHYGYPIIDLLIPILFTFFLLMFSKIITKIKFSSILSYLGYFSLPIMYLHLPINEAFWVRDISYNLIVFLAIGLLPALCMVYVCKKNRWLRIIFLGQIPKEVPMVNLTSHV